MQTKKQLTHKKDKNYFRMAVLLCGALISASSLQIADAARFVSKSKKVKAVTEQQQDENGANEKSESQQSSLENIGEVNVSETDADVRDIKVTRPVMPLLSDPVELELFEPLETDPAPSEPLVQPDSRAQSTENKLSPELKSSTLMSTSSSGLSLREAEEIAVRNDPLIKRSEATEEMYRERAVAAYAWPDPKLRLGVVNLPVDSYDFEQEPMTQAVIGVAQVFPPAGSVGARRDQFNDLAEAAGHGIKDQTLKTRLGVRKSWFNVYLQYQANELVQQSLIMFDQLTQITRSQYRAGRGKQQDVVRAQLEQSLLQDKQKAVAEKFQVAISSLQKWVGAHVLDSELDMEFPQLPRLPNVSVLNAELEKHPALQVNESRVNASEKEVEFSDAQFKPGWMLDLRYGHRGADQLGAERDDFLTAMITMDLPLFSGSKQDKQLLASKAKLDVAKNSLNDSRRVYQQKLNSGLASYQRSAERLELYQSQLLPQAQQNTQATMNAYRSGVTSFNDVVRARLTELKSQLQYLNLRVDQAKAHIDLLYIAGGQ